MAEIDKRTDAMEDRCRCPHPDHDLGGAPGVCPNKSRLNCPMCGTGLCLNCAATHHPRGHHARDAVDPIGNDIARMRGEEVA